MTRDELIVGMIVKIDNEYRSDLMIDPYTFRKDIGGKFFVIKEILDRNPADENPFDFVIEDEDGYEWELPVWSIEKAIHPKIACKILNDISKYL